jgi:hypothetical protein
MQPILALMFNGRGCDQRAADLGGSYSSTEDTPQSRHSNVQTSGNVPKRCVLRISRMFCVQLGHSGSLGPERSEFMTRLGSARYMRGSIGFVFLSDIHSPSVEAREHTLQTCPKAKTDGALPHYKRVAIGLLKREWPVQRRNKTLRVPITHCFIARIQSIRQSVQNGQFPKPHRPECVVLAGRFAWRVQFFSAPRNDPRALEP